MNGDLSQKNTKNGKRGNDQKPQHNTEGVKSLI